MPQILMVTSVCWHVWHFACRVVAQWMRGNVAEKPVDAELTGFWRACDASRD